ncbi:hypothetical protein CU633_15805 [Bacillus sp. V3-13]|uniref:hypothetical protein n=1 Tax=Bacillus sp. V3-13 TaxID=2053728 RepID=UPI000C78543B|nr:hypothetical protein [Bacillus sp. V3-13]PLR76427.1 hypothetical protein CU633_15805 [Bacillus sp. V3-13]
MQTHMELSDYHKWMCKQIKEKLAERAYSFGYTSTEIIDYGEREVITLALSEMLVRLDSRIK